MSGDSVFKLQRRDVLSTADGHVLDAARDDAEAIRIDEAFVVRVKPLEAVFGRDLVRLGGFLGVAVVAFLDSIAMEHDLTTLAERTIVRLLNTDLSAYKRPIRPLHPPGIYYRLELITK